MSKSKVTELNARGIWLPTGSKPSVVCSKEYGRPTLKHGHLITRDDGRWLVATDAYICVALKVTAGAEVEDGIVPVRVLQLLEQRKRVEQVTAHSWKHTRQDGCEVTYDLTKEAANIKQPKFGDLADGALFAWPAKRPQVTDEFAFNGELIGRIGAALGPRGLRVHVTAPLEPIIIEALDDPDRRALAMPIRIVEPSARRKAA